MQKRERATAMDLLITIGVLLTWIALVAMVATELTGFGRHV